MPNLNEKGFVLLELIICLSLVAMMISVCLPIINQLKLEQKVIADRADIHHYLYNKVQRIKREELPHTESDVLGTIELTLEFYMDDQLIVGQGVWINERNQTEEANVYFQGKN